MSGHNKWSTIKHKKGRTDAKRGKIFSRLAKELIQATRDGGKDPLSNARLRTAIASAKAVNMPNDNIERAIKKGAGLGGGVNELEEVLYEGYGPGGSALLVQALTDNRNRTASEIRSRFTKTGGSLAETGAVSWGFQNMGVIVADIITGDPSEVALHAVDEGADDFEIDERNIEFRVGPDSFESRRSALETREDVNIVTAELAMVSTNTLPLAPTPSRQTLRLIDALEELDDVQKVYCNVDFDEAVLSEYAQTY